MEVYVKEEEGNHKTQQSHPLVYTQEKYVQTKTCTWMFIGHYSQQPNNGNSLLERKGKGSEGLSEES